LVAVVTPWPPCLHDPRRPGRDHHPKSGTSAQEKINGSIGSGCDDGNVNPGVSSRCSGCWRGLVGQLPQSRAFLLKSVRDIFELSLLPPDDHQGLMEIVECLIERSDG
jgi:hypothetical protein